MSGAMTAPQPGGAAPNPALIQHLMQVLAAQHAGPPGVTPGQSGIPPPAAAPQAPQPAGPPSRMPVPLPLGTPPAASAAGNLHMFGRAAQGKPGKLKAGQTGLKPAEMAALGRGGDSIIAHLTPGEIEVPPQVQTPQLMAALQQAFGQVGASPAQFTAGSPASSHNPATGAPEYNILGSILPALLGGAAAIFAPELLGAVAPGVLGTLGSAGSSAIAGGLGTALGAGATGASPTQALLSGLGGAAGGFLTGGGASSLFGNGGKIAADTATNAASAMPSAIPTSAIPGSEAAALMAAPSGGPMPGLIGNAASSAPNWGAAKGLLLGSTLGATLAPTPSSASSAALPPGFNQHMPPVNPNYGALLGSNQATTPTFANYNPFQAVTGGGYNFYPTS